MGDLTTQKPTVVLTGMFGITTTLCSEYYVIGSNEYLIFMFLEYLIPDKHTLKILCKSKHFPLRYKRKREWVFFS